MATLGSRPPESMGGRWGKGTGQEGKGTVSQANYLQAGTSGSSERREKLDYSSFRRGRNGMGRVSSLTLGESEEVYSLGIF